MAAAKKLYRSNDSVLAGVCAGFAEYLDIDPVIVRILATLLAITTGGIVLIAYIALWAILPKQPMVDPGAIPCAAYVPMPQEPGFQNVPQPDESPDAANALSGGAKAGVIIGLLLLSIGIAGFLSSIIVDVAWWQLWPAFFLLAGLMLMLVPSTHMAFLNRFSLGISIMALSVVALGVSVGVLSWNTIALSFANMWPVLDIAGGLVILGIALKNRLFGLAAAACVVACCAAALTVYAVPGYLDSVTMDTYFTNPQLFDVNPWN